MMHIPLNIVTGIIPPIGVSNKSIFSDQTTKQAMAVSGRYWWSRAPNFTVTVLLVQGWPINATRAKQMGCQRQADHCMI